MRINQFVAQATGLSRRFVDAAIKAGRVKINDKLAALGQSVSSNDTVELDNKIVQLPSSKVVVLLNKPVGYVSSRKGQGAPTIYELLPDKYASLKPVGRLDKDSEGLIVLTNDGQLAHELGHPSFNKTKVYEVKLDKPINKKDLEDIEAGKVMLEGKPSIMKIKVLRSNLLMVKLGEGRNRQIRRTFNGLGYRVEALRRDNFGPYKLSQLANKDYLELLLLE